MWVLTPISKASQRQLDSSAASTATPNVSHFLISGPLTVGRPFNNMTSDIAVHGDVSVSARHATIKFEHQPGADGGGRVVVVTDSSRFGTVVNEERIEKNKPHTLAAGDTVRFATRSKFRVQFVHMALHMPGGGSPAAQAAAATLDLLPPAEWGPDVTHCIVEDGEMVAAAVACALIRDMPVATGGWLEEIVSRKVWSGELPGWGPYAPQHLTLSAADGPHQLDMASWQSPEEGLLSGWVVVMRDQDVALCELADLSGATRIAPWPPGAAIPDPGLGRTLLAVMPEGLARPPHGSDQGEAEGGAAPLMQGVPHASADDLIYTAMTGDQGPLRHVVEAFLQAQREARRSRLALLDGPAAGGLDEEGGGTEEGVTEEQGGEDEDDEEVTALPDLGLTAGRRQLPGRRSASAAAGATGAGAAATTGVPEQRRQQQMGAAAEEQLEEEHPAAPSPPKAAGRGRKRAAQEAVAADGVEDDPQAPHTAAAAAPSAPSGKRQRRTDGAQAVVEQLDNGAANDHQQQQQQQRGGKRGKEAAAAAAAADQNGGGNASREPVVWAQLVVSGGDSDGAHPSVTSAASGSVRVVDYKAFRRKGQGSAPPPDAVALVPLAVYTDSRRDDAEVQAFLKEEQQRARRAKKADELFNANIKATKAAAAATKAPARKR